MPLNDAIASRNHELSSRISYEAWSAQLKQRVTKLFNIPPTLSTEGIVFNDKNTLFDELRDNFLVSQLLYDHSIRPYYHLTVPYPIELSLPDVFAEGTLTLADSDDHPGKMAQSVLQFADQSNPTIHFNPHSPYHLNLYSTISASTILAAIPRENLSRVDIDTTHIVVMQPIPKEDMYMGYGNSQVLQLTRSRKGIIEASDIVPDVIASEDYWKDYTEACEKLTAKSSGIFFLLD